MHDTAFDTGSKFIELYAKAEGQVIVELGAYNYNGSLRASQPENVTYIGLDVGHGPGVDIVIKPEQPLPLRDNFADMVVSTSQMEHDPRFWVTFLELCRITKDGGAIFLNAPSNGTYHSYPVDVWRFYPDAGKALASWAQDNGHNVTLWESFTCLRSSDIWNDFIAVFHKGTRKGDDKLICDYFSCQNVWKPGETSIEKISAMTEDMLINTRLKSECETMRVELDVARNRVLQLEEELKFAQQV